MKLKHLILHYSPIILQNIAITLYNTYMYKKRHKGNYRKHFNFYANIDNTQSKKIKEETQEIKNTFLKNATLKSNWYNEYANYSLKDFPLLHKSDLVDNLDEIATIKENEGLESYTGGTTGASLKVIYTPEDVVERQAILDSFRFSYGYKIGKKVAWFSGKDIVREKDLIKNISYRDDYINKIRFFSTFHISNQNFETYWSNFTKFSPEFIVGFPSSLFDLCQMAKERNLSYKNRIKVFFPTAENMIDEQKTVIQEVLGCNIIDQYASSEGAPFILQCEKGNMHIHPYTGIFEVLDENGNNSLEGELVVTAFHTNGTPLIRYKVGDRIKLAEKSFLCPCKSTFPVVDEIIGRNNDYIWSKERGRVNLGNISNCTKDLAGIQCFQVIQDSEDEINVLMVTSKTFSKSDKEQFILNLRSRVGDNMKIEVTKVVSIPREKSGKFRIVKNSFVNT